MQYIIICSILLVIHCHTSHFVVVLNVLCQTLLMLWKHFQEITGLYTFSCVNFWVDRTVWCILMLYLGACGLTSAFHSRVLIVATILSVICCCSKIQNGLIHVIVPTYLCRLSRQLTVVKTRMYVNWLLYVRWLLVGTGWSCCSSGIGKQCFTNYA